MRFDGNHILRHWYGCSSRHRHQRIGIRISDHFYMADSIGAQNPERRRTKTTPCQSCSWAREEGLLLQIADVARDLALFKAISHICADAGRELVFNFKRIDLAFLFEELVPCLRNNVCS